MNDAPVDATKAGIPSVIDSFRGEWGFLSNFSAAKVTLDGVEYPTVEHAYQAAKVSPAETCAGWEIVDGVKRLIEKPWRVWILECSSPNQAKHLGHDCPQHHNWDTIKDHVMRDLLWQKFAPGRIHHDLLLRTGEAHLVEGNTWHDNYWGDCRCEGVRCRRPGVNMLGRLLMEIRAARRQVRGVTT